MKFSEFRNVSLTSFHGLNLQNDLSRSVSVCDEEILPHYKRGSTQFNYVRQVDGQEFVLFHKFFDAVQRNADIKVIEEIVYSDQMVSCFKQLILYPQHFSPLHFAIFSKRADVVKLLLHAGAMPNAKELDSTVRPLHLAVIFGYADIIDLLVGFGADTRQKGTLVHNSILYRGTPAEMAAIGPNSYRQLVILEALEGQRNYPDKIRKEYEKHLESTLEEMKSELKKAERVHKTMEKLHKSGQDLLKDESYLGRFHNERLEITWALEKLDNSKDNRTPERIRFLKERIQMMEEKMEEERKTAEKNPVMLCPVCLDVPMGSVFTCQTCDNLVCNACKFNVDQMQKCPMCRENLNLKPLVRNRPLERFITAFRLSA